MRSCQLTRVFSGRLRGDVGRTGGFGPPSRSMLFRRVPTGVRGTLRKRTRRWRPCETYVSTQCPQTCPSTRLPPPDVDPFGSGHHPEPPSSRTRPVVSLIERVSDRGSFVALRSPSLRVRRGAIRLAWIPDPRGRRRVAYALPRRIGSAVVRNRIRRRLRAVFRTLDDERSSGVTTRFPPGTYLVSAESVVATLPYEQMVATVRKLLIEVDQHGSSQ